MKITTTEIARRLGLSQSTVSRVLKGNPRISKQTSEKVLKLVKELNYRPNMLARSLVSGCTNIIGILTSGLHVESTSAKAMAIDNLARKHGYKTSLRYTKGEEERILETAREMAENQYDGIVIIHSGPYSEKLCNEIASLNIPVVFSGGDFELPLNQVIYDTCSVYLELANYLHTAGHKNIAVFWKKGFKEHFEADRRLAMIMKGLKEFDCWDPQKVFPIALSTLPAEIDEEFDSKTQEEASLIWESLKKVEDCSVIICHNDILANAVMVTASTMGYKIPEDISVIGFNNSILSSLTKPALTTIGGGIQELAEKTFSLLLRVIKKPSLQNELEVAHCKLIKRDSVNIKNI